VIATDYNKPARIGELHIANVPTAGGFYQYTVSGYSTGVTRPAAAAMSAYLLARQGSHC
jgi:GH25 family lysozyme M1 (1,4-beta-N-acetylmuramidase)